MENRKMNIAFFGTSQFAAIILERLIQAGVVPVLVITTPDKPSGRKQLLAPPPVKVLAEKYNIEVFQPERFSKEAIQKIQSLEIDLIVLAAYGAIVPKSVLSLPTYGALNVHPSLLPKFRGASPVQSALLAGETETGVTIMLMDEQVDHGPLLAQERLRIGHNSYEEVHNELAEIGAELLIRVIPQWINEEIQAVEQDHSQATFTKKFTKEDGRIDWNQKPEYIDRQIRAFTPWPGAFMFWKGKRIKILKAHVEQDLPALPTGQVGGRQEKLVIDELQMEGKNPTTYKEFLLGHPDFSFDK